MLASSQLGRGRRVSSSMKSGSSEEGHSFGSMSVEPLIQDDPLSNSNKRISSGSSGSVIIGDAIGGKSEQQVGDPYLIATYFYNFTIAVVSQQLFISGIFPSR